MDVEYLEVLDAGYNRQPIAFVNAAAANHGLHSHLALQSLPQWKVADKSCVNLSIISLPFRNAHLAQFFN